MRSASFSDFSHPDRASIRRRVAAFVLAAIANLLLIAMLLGIAPFVTKPDKGPPALNVFDLSPEDGTATPTPATKVAKATRPSGGSPTRAPRPLPLPRPTPSPDDTPTKPLDMIVLSKEAFASADISRMRSTAPAVRAGGSGGGTGAGDDSGADDGAARGPGGERLYNAEWYREPTDAELGGYIPARAPRNGWGMIACRTVANYRVEDCVSLGESPGGSGLAEAVRQAAWQFRVQPPRVGAKRLVGEWVRIRIDYSQRAAK